MKGKQLLRSNNYSNSSTIWSIFQYIFVDVQYTYICDQCKHTFIVKVCKLKMVEYGTTSVIQIESLTPVTNTKTQLVNVTYLFK